MSGVAVARKHMRSADYSFAAVPGSVAVHDLMLAATPAPGDVPPNLLPHERKGGPERKAGPQQKEGPAGAMQLAAQSRTTSAAEHSGVYTPTARSSNRQAAAQCGRPESSWTSDNVVVFNPPRHQCGAVHAVPEMLVDAEWPMSHTSCQPPSRPQSIMIVIGNRVEAFAGQASRTGLTCG